MRLRICTNITPEKPITNSAELAEKIYNYIGLSLSVVDSTGWGLLRLGLLTKRLIIDVCRL